MAAGRPELRDRSGPHRTSSPTPRQFEPSVPECHQLRHRPSRLRRTFGNSTKPKFRLPCLAAHVLMQLKSQSAGPQGSRHRSHTERVSVRKALDFGRIQRSHRARIVEPDIFIELLWQVDAEIVARKLGLGPVDHADGALEALLAEAFRTAEIAAGAQAKHEAPMPRRVTEPLVASRQRRPDGLDLHRAVPFRSRGDGAAMCTEADQIGRVAELLAAELTDIV